MIRSYINKKFIMKSSTMAASNFIQFASISAIIVIISRIEGHAESALYGSLISLYGLLLMLPTGLMIWQISSFAPELIKLKKAPEGFKEKISRNLFYLNSTFDTHNKFILKILFFIWLLILIAILFLASAQSAAFWISILPIILVSPFISSLQAKLQVAQKENKILLGNLSIATINVFFTYFLLHIQLLKNSPYTLAFLGCIQSISGIILLMYLLMHKKSLPLEYSKKLPHLESRVTFSSFRKIVSGSIDGIVLSATFSLAIIVAMQNSPRDGFLISLVVSIMRMIVIPSKQFGLVGGRMHLMGEVKNIKTIVLSSFVSIVVVSSVIIPAYIVKSSISIPSLITVLILVQIAIEPLSGVLYGFLKIRVGTEKALYGLLFSYILFSIPLLILFSIFKFANAENVWGILFMARIIFTFSVMWILYSNRDKIKTSIRKG